MFEGGLGAAVIVAGLEGLAFVVALFAFSYGYTELDVAAAGQDFQRHDGFALLLGVDEGLDFAALGQQFAGPGLVRFADRYAGGAGDGGVDQE